MPRDDVRHPRERANPGVTQTRTGIGSISRRVSPRLESPSMFRDTQTVAVPLTMRRFSSLPEDLDDGGCLACKGPLDLHQPDVGSPDRMVGVCMKCGRWYLLDSIAGTDEALMVLLPDSESFQDTRRV